MEFDAALVVLGVASDRPTVELDGSKEFSTCFTGKGNECDIQLLGWGSTYTESPSTAQTFHSTSVPLWKCRHQLKPWALYNITDTMVCSGKLAGNHEEPCQGDKGGPLMYNGRQVGVFSWGIGCASSRIPSVHTAILSIFPWLQREISSIKEVRVWMVCSCHLSSCLGCSTVELLQLLSMRRETIAHALMMVSVEVFRPVDWVAASTWSCTGTMSIFVWWMVAWLASWQKSLEYTKALLGDCVHSNWS